LEEAVGIGRQWERSRESLELRKREDAGEEEESHGMAKRTRTGGGRGRAGTERRQKWESRTLQGIKSLFVTGTVMKILCFSREREREREGRRRRAEERERKDETTSTLPHRGSLEYQSSG